MENEGIAVKRQPLPTVRNVEFEVVTWAPDQADADLSIACMFEREMPGSQLSGGLLKLDDVFGGALTRLRDEGSFQAQEMETLVIRKPPAPVKARAIMLIGLGDPLTLSSAVLVRALRVSFHEAARLGVSTVAFAPNLLDAGLSNLAPLGVEAAMVSGVLGALNAEHRFAELGIATPPTVRRWVFDTGAAHFDIVAKSLLTAFGRFTSVPSE